MSKWAHLDKRNSPVNVMTPDAVMMHHQTCGEPQCRTALCSGAQLSALPRHCAVKCASYSSRNIRNSARCILSLHPLTEIPGNPPERASNLESDPADGWTGERCAPEIAGAEIQWPRLAPTGALCLRRHGNYVVKQDWTLLRAGRGFSAPPSGLSCVIAKHRKTFSLYLVTSIYSSRIFQQKKKEKQMTGQVSQVNRAGFLNPPQRCLQSRQS